MFSTVDFTKEPGMIKYLEFLFTFSPIISPQFMAVLILIGWGESDLYLLWLFDLFPYIPG